MAHLSGFDIMCVYLIDLPLSLSLARSSPFFQVVWGQDLPVLFVAPLVNLGAFSILKLSLLHPKNILSEVKALTMAVCRICRRTPHGFVIKPGGSPRMVTSCPRSLPTGMFIFIQSRPMPLLSYTVLTALVYFPFLPSRQTAPDIFGEGIQVHRHLHIPRRV